MACQWKDVPGAVERYVLSESDRIDKLLHGIIPQILKRRGVAPYDLDSELVRQTAYHTAKDLAKLAIYQDDRVDPIKQIGTLCFWVRKLKPVRSATYISGQEMYDANERLSLWMLKNNVVAWLQRENIYKAGVNSAFNRLWNDQEYFDYLIHCLRYRTFGPHHYIVLARTIVRAF